MFWRHLVRLESSSAPVSKRQISLRTSYFFRTISTWQPCVTCQRAFAESREILRFLSSANNTFPSCYRHADQRQTLPPVPRLYASRFASSEVPLCLITRFVVLTFSDIGTWKYCLCSYVFEASEFFHFQPSRLVSSIFRRTHIWRQIYWVRARQAFQLTCLLAFSQVLRSLRNSTSGENG